MIRYCPMTIDAIAVSGFVNAHSASYVNIVIVSKNGSILMKFSYTLRLYRFGHIDKKLVKRFKKPLIFEV